MRTQDGDLFSMHLVDYSIHIPSFRIMGDRDFPGGPVVKTLCFHCGATTSVPGCGTRSCKVLVLAARCSQKPK